MTATFAGWYADTSEWASSVWNTFNTSAEAVLGAGMEIFGVILSTLVLIAVFPFLVHLTVPHLLWLLGAPLWWVVAALLFLN
jgi:hypothetical protein